MGDVRISAGAPFLDGVSYSPHYGFDFGDDLRVEFMSGTKVNADGLHHNDRAALVWNDFAQLAASGVHAVRMHLFADGRTGIDFAPKDRGRAISVQPSVLR